MSGSTSRMVVPRPDALSARMRPPHALGTAALGRHLLELRDPLADIAEAHGGGMDAGPAVGCEDRQIPLGMALLPQERLKALGRRPLPSRALAAALRKSTPPPGRAAITGSSVAAALPKPPPQRLQAEHRRLRMLDSVGF
jgi:hypothetical protein